MRSLVLFLTLTAVLSAAELPKNLLRYSSGALPMIQNSNNQWVSVAPESIDWNANYAAVLAGDIGKTIDLSKNSSNSYVVDLGKVQTLNRISLASRTATGSVSVAASPVFEDPKTGKWSELGSMNLTNGSASSLTATTDARYLKFTFSTNSTGIISSMGVYGNVTYAQVRAPLTLQSQNPVAVTYQLNYATPATKFTIVSTQPASEMSAVAALFDDDPATQYTASQPVSITVDMGASRQIDTLYISSSSNSAVSVKYANTLQELSSATSQNYQAMYKAANSNLTAYKAIGANGAVNARFAQISMTPSTSGFDGLSFVGPVVPQGLVFEEAPASETPAAAAATTPTNPVPVTPITPQIISGGGITPTIIQGTDKPASTKAVLLD